MISPRFGEARTGPWRASYRMLHVPRARYWQITSDWVGVRAWRFTLNLGALLGALRVHLVHLVHFWQRIFMTSFWMIMTSKFTYQWNSLGPPLGFPLVLFLSTTRGTQGIPLIVVGANQLNETVIVDKNHPKLFLYRNCQQNYPKLFHYR